MSVPHPIPYQGSKRALADLILSRLPLKMPCLIEPFAGSAAISLAAAHGGRADHFLINDINGPLMALWDAIIRCPGGIVAEYSRLWEEQNGRERDFYDETRRRFNLGHDPSQLLYLLARCVKASVRYNARGEFNQSPDNRRSGARPEVMARHINAASKLLAGRTVVSSADYRRVLESAGPDDVIYMDPPYQGVSGERDARYIKGLDVGQFIGELAGLNDRGIPYLVSFDGRCGSKAFGVELPKRLALRRIEVRAGKSTQATLLGRDLTTYESLYLSPGLMERLPARLRPILDPIDGIAQESFL